MSAIAYRPFGDLGQGNQGRRRLSTDQFPQSILDRRMRRTSRSPSPWGMLARFQLAPPHRRSYRPRSSSRWDKWARRCDRSLSTDQPSRPEPNYSLESTAIYERKCSLRRDGVRESAAHQPWSWYQWECPRAAGDATNASSGPESGILGPAACCEWGPRSRLP